MTEKNINDLHKLIEDANKIHDTTGEVQFIFSTATKYYNENNIEEKRDNVLDEVDDFFYIDTIDAFKDAPSRESVYDTIYRESNKFRRRDKIYQSLSKLGFEPSMYNLGEDYEQSFVINVGDLIINIRLSKNLFCKVSAFNLKDHRIDNIYYGFYIESKILKAFATCKIALSLQMKRQFKFFSLEI